MDLLSGNFIFEVLELGRELPGPKELLLRFGEKAKTMPNIDNALVREIASKNESVMAADEVVLNTGKPYVDNRLSGYSAYGELIGYYNSGYRSCMILPISGYKKHFGTVTLLSKKEDTFDKQYSDSLQLLANIVSNQALMISEEKKSLDVARYFDASFNSTFPQMLIDSTGKIVKANKSSLNMLNKSSVEAPGMKISDYLDVDDAGLKALASGTAIVVTEKSTGKRFKASGSLVNDNLEHVALQEITTIEELDAKAALLDSSDEIHMLLNPKMEITWVSKNAERIAKANPNMLLGRKLQSIIYGDDAPKLKLPNDKPLRANLRLDFGRQEYPEFILNLYKTKFGYSCTISRDYSRYFAYVQKNIDDIIELVADPVMVLDSSGYIRGYNKVTGRALKYGNPEDLKGMPITSLYADNASQNRLSSSLSISKESGTVTDIFVNIVSKNGGEPLPFIQSIKSMKDENANTTGYLVLSRELSTKKLIDQLESENERNAKNAERSNSESELKTQFINNISHDLKTPITSISGYSKLMLDGALGDITEEQREYIQIILDSSNRLMSLIQQILDVAKLEAGKIKLDLQPVSFNALSENPSIKDMAILCENKGLTFEWFKADYDVPEVKADPNRLIQVFVNLIGNAVKFTEKGGITVRVTKKGKNVKVAVQDTGIGISEAEIKRIFKKFYQVQRKDLKMPPGTGTGLGLSIVKEIVESLHHGRVWVESEVGKGSTFYFTIPIDSTAVAKKKKSKSWKAPQ